MEELPHDHHCAKNWSESSKAMEPMGIVECAIKIWDSGKAWLHVFVSDDDSSSRAALKHSYEDKISLNEPVDPKKKGSGKLPAWILEPIFLVDPSH